MATSILPVGAEREEAEGISPCTERRIEQDGDAPEILSPADGFGTVVVVVVVVVPGAPGWRPVDWDKFCACCDWWSSVGRKAE